MLKSPGFRSSLASLWFRLTTLAIIGLVFAEALFLAPARVQGWSYYLSAPEVIFEVGVRVIFAALVGIALGSICTAALAPVLWRFHSSRARVIEWATKVAVILAIFLDSRFALIAVIRWSGRGVRFTPFLLAAHALAFALALCFSRARQETLTSLDGFLGHKMTRRTALATVTATTVLVATEFALGKTGRRVQTALAPPRPKSNFLLVTFDAMGAEDMSVYGYRLPTTPNIEAFARKSTVFTNFYSASTFTTPSVATMMTGFYPSEHRVYQLEGRLREENAEKNLPYLMGTGSYATGAFLSNPFAYYFVDSLKNGFDVLPEPAFLRGASQVLWDATGPLHQRSGIGSRIEEYKNLEWTLNVSGQRDLSMRFRPEASFEQARQILAKLPEGFFLWVHVITPHQPYIPDAADRGRFLPYEEQRLYEEESDLRWKPHYGADQQGQVDRRRLLYDEFIASADRAFGAFISELENSGKLQNTTVVISADHGESFEGGVFQHESPYLTRPVIHIPLIIRTPDQQEGCRVAFTADQTVLAPTILELAGQKQPEWMRGQSIVQWLNRDGQGGGQGQAFCQFFEKNSVFQPLRHGTVGVIDGKSQYQYVLDLDTQKGSLRPLNEAHIWNIDQSSKHPDWAESLRTALHEKFPNIVPAK